MDTGIPGTVWVLREWEPEDAARCRRYETCTRWLNDNSQTGRKGGGHEFNRSDRRPIAACDHVVPPDRVLDLLFGC